MIYTPHVPEPTEPQRDEEPRAKTDGEEEPSQEPRKVERGDSKGTKRARFG